MFAQIKNL